MLHIREGRRGSGVQCRQEEMVDYDQATYPRYMRAAAAETRPRLWTHLDLVSALRTFPVSLLGGSAQVTFLLDPLSSTLPSPNFTLGLVARPYSYCYQRTLVYSTVIIL